MKKVESIESFLNELKRRKTPIQVKILLNFGLFSRHNFKWSSGKISHFSWVDNSREYLTPEEFKKSFYGEAIRKQAMFYS